MILTDREIEIALQCGQLIINPRPDPTAYSSTSVDLTLSDVGEEWIARKGFPIQPGNPGYSYSSTAKDKKPIKFDRYPLPSHGFVLAWTKEYIELPPTSRLAARVEGKSSIARLGVGVHVTAPTIHAGFKGQIVLEMFNFGPNEILLDAGLKICQLIFEQTVGTPQKGYAGIFSGQAQTA